MRRLFLQLTLGWVLALPTLVPGQSPDLALDFATFLDLVKTQHPLALQAQLQPEKGAATLQKARGAFDPKLFSEANQKQFGGKEYYTQFHSGLKIPTWFGAELKAGYEQNGGTYVNPESGTPIGGLGYAGISVPVGQGLWMDERRASLRSAEIYAQSTEAERRILLNDLLFEAGKAYWEWAYTFGAWEVNFQALGLAKARLEGVRQAALLGDRPMVDTLEASIQVQTREMAVQQAWLDRENAALILSLFLWVDGRIPLEISSETYPPRLQNLVPSTFTLGPAQMDSLLSNHPEVQAYSLKKELLVVEKRLKQEQLKPVLNLQYNALLAPVNGFSGYSPNNYKWGVQFEIPLFLRKSRGEVALANLKIRETDLGINAKGALILTKVQQYQNEGETTRTQAELFAKTVQQYAQLLESERRLFEVGESSLFLVNAREAAWQTAQIKWLEILSKNQKAILGTRWALGILAE